MSAGHVVDENVHGVARGRRPRPWRRRAVLVKEIKRIVRHRVCGDAAARTTGEKVPRSALGPRIVFARHGRMPAVVPPLLLLIVVVVHGPGRGRRRGRGNVISAVARSAGRFPRVQPLRRRFQHALHARRRRRHAQRRPGRRRTPIAFIVAAPDPGIEKQARRALIVVKIKIVVLIVRDPKVKGAVRQGSARARART
jgi:hypothetical protein